VKVFSPENARIEPRSFAQPRVRRVLNSVKVRLFSDERFRHDFHR
jgi:hypothetical protein